MKEHHTLYLTITRNLHFNDPLKADCWQRRETYRRR